VLRLRDLVTEHTPPRPDLWSAEDQRAVSYVVIEAANLWEGYCRSFYLSTALRARDSSGQRVTLTYHRRITSVEEALTIAVHEMDPRTRTRHGPWTPGEEPDWPNTGHMRRVVRLLGASNLPKLDRALGLLPSALNDIRTVRNYFAHKAERSATSVGNLPRNYGITRRVHPVEFLFLTAPPRRGFPTVEPVLLRWLDAMYRTIRLTTA
jgi:hypothetical protein